MGSQLNIEGWVLHEWKHQLTPEEIQERKDLSIKLSNEIDKIEEEKKAANDEFKKEIKSRSHIEKRCRDEVRTGYIIKIEKAKPVMDFVKQIVDFFDEEGNKVDSRPMTRKEIKEGEFVNN
jgi:hypothetical protein